MKRLTASLLLAGTSLICASNTWAWNSDGDKIKLTEGETAFCRTWQNDGTLVMYARQKGEPTPTYPDDAYSEPSDEQKKMRAYFIREAKNVQVANTEKEHVAVSEAFGVQMLNRCVGLVTSLPSSKEP